MASFKVSSQFLLSPPGLLLSPASGLQESSVSRPFAQTGAPVRQTNSRQQTHSISLGAVNANHRVSRRKSVTSSAAANAAAAVAASLKEHGEPAGIPVAASHRRGANARKGLESSSMGTASGSGFSSYLSRSVNESTAGRKHSPSSIDENTAVDGGGPVGRPVSTKNRNRRASEGSHLVRGEGKRFSTELRCEQCGKGYKHSSCLTKHMCVYPWRPMCCLSLAFPLRSNLDVFV